MRARTFTRHTPGAVKRQHRHVYDTDHPNVFEVIGSDGTTRYRVVLLPPVMMPVLPDDYKAICNCEIGVRLGTQTARSKPHCWHAGLVVERRFVDRFVTPSARKEVANGRRAEW